MKAPSYLSFSLRSISLVALAALTMVCSASEGAPLVKFMPSNTWPSTDWYQSNYSSPAVAVTTVNDRSWMSIGRTASNIGAAQLVYTAGSYTEASLPQAAPSNQLSNYTGHVILGATGWNTTDGIGVVLRSRVSAFSGTDAYFLAVTSNGLGLYWDTGVDFVTNATSLASGSLSTTLSSLANGGEYLLQFSAIGTKIDAALYSAWTLDESGNPVGTPIASLTYTDVREEARLSGYLALRGGRFGSNRTAYFRELEVYAIPEPSGAMLGLTGAGMALGACLLRSRKAQRVS